MICLRPERDNDTRQVHMRWISLEVAVGGRRAIQKILENSLAMGRTADRMRRRLTQNGSEMSASKSEREYNQKQKEFV